MVDSRRRSWLRRKRGKRQKYNGDASSSSSAASSALAMLLLLLVAPYARAQPFTINTSTNEVSHIPWIVEDAVVANQVREREREAVERGIEGLGRIEKRRLPCSRPPLLSTSFLSSLLLLLLPTTTKKTTTNRSSPQTTAPRS